MATEHEVKQILAVLVSVYPKTVPGSSAIPTYVSLLADIPAELLQQAALAHIAGNSFFPTIAELRQMAFELQEAANPLPDAHSAWGEVLREMDRVGSLTQYGQSIHFSHALIAEVVEMLGWQRLCASENSISDRAQFVAAYNARLESYRRESRRPLEVRRYLEAQRSLLSLAAGEDRGEA